MLVVVDKFSKFSHFIPLRHPFTAASLARLFMDNIYKLHNMPKSIISDRDCIFTGTLWQLLLRCFVHAYPTQWSRWLSLAEFWYNIVLEVL